MNSSDQNTDEQLSGQQLMDLIVTLTGLSHDAIQKELTPILENMGCNAEKLTMDQLRLAMVSYLESFTA